MECTLYKIRVPDKLRRERKLHFYAWRKNEVSKAIVLGFADYDITPQEAIDACLISELNEKVMKSRTMAIRNTEVTDSKGRIFSEKWECQAVLVALWRKLESLGFLKLPRNPFIGRKPKHEDIVDYEARFRWFRRRCKQGDVND